MKKLYLCFLLILFLIGCSAPVKTFRDRPEVRRWEPEIAIIDSLSKAENYPDDAILFTGSSSIRLWKTLAEDMAPYQVIQRGYGGAKLSDFAVYSGRIFSQVRCSAAVVFIANDITGSPEDKTPEEVRKLFLFILKTFRRYHHGKPFFWVQITPTPSRWKAWPQINLANELIRKECMKRRNTCFIQTDYAFLDGNGLPREELFISDKLHLNGDGYRIWSAIIKDSITKVKQTSD